MTRTRAGVVDAVGARSRRGRRVGSSPHQLQPRRTHGETVWLECLIVNGPRHHGGRRRQGTGGPQLRHHAGQQLGADQGGHLLGVAQVPVPGRGDVGQDHAGQEVGRLVDLHALGHAVLVQIGDEEPGDEPHGPVGLDGELGHEHVGLGLEHLLEHLVLDERSPGEDQTPVEHLLERGRAVDLFVEPAEEREELPRHHGVDELVTTTGEVAVHRGPRQSRLACRVLDGRLRQPPARHARIGRLEDALAGPLHGPRLPPAPQNPRSVSSPTVRPGRSATAFTARIMPGMNEVRS